MKRFRYLSNDPLKLGKHLTQDRLAALLSEALGIPPGSGYCVDTIANWETQNAKRYTQIHKDNRAILLGLIQVFHRCGGIETVTGANRFLHAGNYRALDAKEVERIFGKQPPLSEPTIATQADLLILFKRMVRALEEIEGPVA